MQNLAQVQDERLAPSITYNNAHPPHNAHAVGENHPEVENLMIISCVIIFS